MYIDINVSTGPWPFQRFALSSLNDLQAHLSERDIEAALVSHLGTVFHADPQPFNEELSIGAAGLPAIRPVPVINPTLPGWERMIETLISEHAPTAVKALPSQHLYSLESAEAEQLAGRLLEAGLPLLLQLRLEDERSQYRGLNTRGVPADQIIGLHRRFPALSIVCLNAYLPEAISIAGQTAETVCFDIAFTEHGNTVDFLTAEIVPERLLLGSHTPFLYTDAALLKIRHSTRDEAVKRRIGGDNARRIFRL